MNHVATTSKKQRTVAQADLPEWPSYFYDVRRLSLSTTLHPVECPSVIQGAYFVVYAHVLFLSMLPSQSFQVYKVCMHHGLPGTRT